MSKPEPVELNVEYVTDEDEWNSLLENQDKDTWDDGWDEYDED
jgi:hypothetical protein